MSQPRWLNEREERAWRGYVRMNQMLLAQIERDLMSRSKLSMADYLVLFHLSEDEQHRVRLTELSERMLWSKSRLSHHLTRMENRGLIRRQECNEDARGLWVTLTDDGLKATKDATPGHVESVRANLIDLLSVQQLETLAEISQLVLERLAENGECLNGESPCPAASPSSID